MARPAQFRQFIHSVEKRKQEVRPIVVMSPLGLLVVDHRLCYTDITCYQMQ